VLSFKPVSAALISNVPGPKRMWSLATCAVSAVDKAVPRAASVSAEAKYCLMVPSDFRISTGEDSARTCPKGYNVRMTAGWILLTVLIAFGLVIWLRANLPFWLRPWFWRAKIHLWKSSFRCWRMCHRNRWISYPQLEIASLRICPASLGRWLLREKPPKHNLAEAKAILVETLRKFSEVR
jgi:hypothetical protein